MARLNKRSRRCPRAHHARMPQPLVDALAVDHGFDVRMILSENRFPSPIGVEGMLFGIMRATLLPG